jgi:hypothetical protein
LPRAIPTPWSPPQAYAYLNDNRRNATPRLVPALKPNVTAFRAAHQITWDKSGKCRKKLTLDLAGLWVLGGAPAWMGEIKTLGCFEWVVFTEDLVDKALDGKSLESLGPRLAALVAHYIKTGEVRVQGPLFTPPS